MGYSRIMYRDLRINENKDHIGFVIDFYHDH
jgi:hypothetical protein